MTVSIEVKNVSLQYGEQFALKDISFQLQENKIYGLLGRNGAGKTSLLSLLAAFREPTGGTITVNGEPVFENGNVMRQVSFIFQKDYKDEADRVKTFLENTGRYRPNFDMDYAIELAEKFKLPLNKPMKQLSKGMQAAANVVLGLASRTPITIFDEAYNGMDAQTREIFYQEVLADQAEHPRLMILSTHLVSEMDYLFDEVLILNKGELVLHEEYETLITKGASITGAAEQVDAFVQGKNILNTKQLGKTKSVTIFGNLSETERRTAEENGLEVGPVALQDMFIYLTEGEE